MAPQAANFNVNDVFQIDHSQKVSSLITINVKHFVICVAVYESPVICRVGKNFKS